MKAHFIAAATPFQKFVDKEEQNWLAINSWTKAFAIITDKATDPLCDSNGAREELICNTCKRCLTNLYLHSKKDDICFECWRDLVIENQPNNRKLTVAAQKKIMSYTELFRFYVIESLQMLIVKQKKLIEQ